ncbi:MAG: DUF805 domain-containing protein [Boseongicola sp. SB0675_bin_26]|nr:DUF805 domain-containing protein [Boseongicola sp. SB0675_bin_26]
MTFTQAVKTCFRKYADFSGRATRPEWWYFFLFCILVQLALGFAEGLFRDLSNPHDDAILPVLFYLAILLPSLAVGARRLHDIDRSGWWQLVWVVPVLGWILLLYWYVKPGTKSENRFG